jgi:flagellar biosynthesis GTPase FlhF
VDLKTYRSNSMAGALAEVKKDLGPDAVILRTRNYKAGGVMGFGGNTVVEITAARETPGVRRTPVIPVRRRPRPLRDPRRSTPPGTPPMRRSSARSATRRATATRPDAMPAPRPTAAVPRRAGRRGRTRLAGPSPSTSTDRSRSSPRTTARTRRSRPSSPRSASSWATCSARRARRHIRVEGAGAFAPSAVAPNDPLYSLYGTLCDHGVPGDLADEIVGRVRTDLDANREPASPR